MCATRTDRRTLREMGLLIIGERGTGRGCVCDMAAPPSMHPHHQFVRLIRVHTRWVRFRLTFICVHIANNYIIFIRCGRAQAAKGVRFKVVMKNITSSQTNIRYFYSRLPLRLPFENSHLIQALNPMP